MSHPKWFENLEENSSCKISQVVAHTLKDNTQDKSGDGPETVKSKASKRVGDTLSNRGNNLWWALKIKPPRSM